MKIVDEMLTDFKRQGRKLLVWIPCQREPTPTAKTWGATWFENINHDQKRVRQKLMPLVRYRKNGHNNNNNNTVAVAEQAANAGQEDGREADSVVEDGAPRWMPPP